MDQDLEELLEDIWKRREETAGPVPQVDPEKEARLEKEGQILRTGCSVFLTMQGEDYARRLIRRHRLWEVFLKDVLGLRDFEKDACSMEHETSNSVEESLCDFLGHPDVCPDGKPIPRGVCCGRRFRRRGGSGFFQQMGLKKLSESGKGDKVKVACIFEKELSRLSSYGIVPGKIVEVVEVFPGFILKIDETEIGLDRGLCEGILIQPIEQAKD